jgi:hypothetical protein
VSKDDGRLPAAPGYSAEPEPVPVSALRASVPSAEDAISRAEVVAWLRARGDAHSVAALLPRQTLPDRLRREGSASTCRMMADQLSIGWGVPEGLKPASAIEARSGETAQQARSGTDESAVSAAETPGNTPPEPLHKEDIR